MTVLYSASIYAAVSFFIVRVRRCKACRRTIWPWQRRVREYIGGARIRMHCDCYGAD